MPYSNLGLQEPSTITARVATVTVNRGSTVEHQEIMVIGDANSSLGLARVLAATPASTEYGLAVRIVEQPSTIVAVSSLSGNVRVVNSSAADLLVRPVFSSTSTDNPVSAAQSGAWTVRANLSSTGTDNPVSAAQSGSWTVRATLSSTNTDNPVRALLSSTATDNPVSAAQSGTWNIGTVTTVSSLAGIVAVRPSDTNWASSAGFHFTSSGELQVSGTFSASTIVTVSTGTVGIAGFYDSSNSLIKVADSANNAIKVNVVAGAAGGSTIVTVSTGTVGIAGYYDSSGTLIKVADSVNNALKVNVVAGAAGGSTIVTVSTIQGVVSVAATTSANSSAYLPVRLSDGTAFISVSADYTDGSTYTTLTGPGLAFNNSSNNTFRTVGLTTPLPMQITDSSNAAVKPGDSANNAVRVNVVAGSAASTIVTVSTGTVGIAGFYDSSNSLIKVADSANNAIKVNVVAGAAGGSTIVTVSTGTVGIAGYYDSSGTLIKVADSVNNALKVNVVAGAAGGSTIVTVSTIQGVVSVAATTSANSSAYLPIRLTNGTAFLTPSVDYADGSTYSGLTGPALSFSNSSNDTFRVAGLVNPFPIQVTDSSNAGVKPGDSANNAVRVNVVAGSAASTIVTVAAFGAGAISSGVVAGNSSALTVRNVWSSTNTDQPVSATLNLGGLQSSAVANSNSSALLVRVVAHGSSAADFPVLATIGTNIQSTAAPSSNSSGLTVRQVIDNILTTVSTNAFSASTALTIQSSAANLRSYVTAYSILSTNAGPHKIKFSAGSTALWPVIFAAVSSAVSGANLAVSAPAYLFRTAAADPLTLNLSAGASTIGGYQVAVSYFRAP